MRAALVAEYRKLVTTRMWWVLLIALAAYLAFIGGVMGFSLTVAPQPEDGTAMLEGAELAAAVYSLVNAVGYVFPLVIGSLAMTMEFRHQTITQSLLVEPRRSVFLGAKLLVTVPLGLLYGLVATVAVVGVAGPLLEVAGDGAFLTDGRVLQVILLGVVVSALWAVIGVAFGSVLTNQVAAIVVILAFTQFVEPIARLGLGAFDATEGVARFLPGAAADGLMGASFFAAFGGGESDLLPRWAALLVLLAYAGGLALVGRLTTLRRDIG
ncbi:ABC transporter permease [Nocardioides sp.]|uniref:ABC transporter permease n=1 Tax=Nocardioides sp. TaxID=35761 RepID=UPI001A31A902|nr:ABC transporter permease [Nocardioides sp.]MBJ7357337.1 ABC transporter permease [Nocardioides sp.]